MNYAIFIPSLDHTSYLRRKSYYANTGKRVRIIRQLKGGCYKVKTEDGEEFVAPKRYLNFIEE